ncbi:MAG: hypothetical protein HYR79_03140 [Nitrospirae bacterium]|nr:hypothetical protein [Nitrospirota bacterium]
MAPKNDVVHNNLNGNDCSSCHSSTTSFTTWTMRHTGIVALCSTCHAQGNTVGAVFKPATHVATAVGQDCSACHTSTTTFTGAGYNHTGITGSHKSGGTGMAPKNDVVHNNLNGNDCSSCHSSTTSFTTWTMRHTGIVALCSTCHAQGNTVGAVFKPANHIATALGQDCSACHTSTTTFTGAAFNHTTAQVMPGTCTNCHGTTATGKPATHLATNLSCDQCHRTTAWIPASYANHNNPKLIGGHSGLDCRTCHSTTFSSAIYRDGTTYGSCANCHKRNYKYPGPREHQVGPTLATSLAANATCSNCHEHAGYHF